MQMKKKSRKKVFRKVPGTQFEARVKQMEAKFYKLAAKFQKASHKLWSKAIRPAQHSTDVQCLCCRDLPEAD